MNEIKKTTLHPDNQPNVDLYPKTSTDQIEGLNNIITEVNNEIEKKVNTADNFVRIFTIPNGASSGKLTADVKEKLCNPDGHNYYVYDDTSEMILKYSFNEENEIIQYKAVYFQTNRGYEITMQILPSNGSWSRSQIVLNVPTSAGGKLYQHDLTIRVNTDDTLKGVIIGKIINTDSAVITTFTNTMLKKTMFDMRIYKGDPIKDRNNIYLTDRYVNDASYINASGSVSIYGYSAGTSTYPFSDNLEEIISGTSFTVVDTVTEL